MAKKKHKENQPLFSGLKDETKHGVLAIVFFVLAIFFVLAWTGIGGPAGNALYHAFDTLLGFGYIMLPVVFLLLSVSFFKETRPNFALPTSIGAGLFLLSTLGLLYIGGGARAGGIVGEYISMPFIKFFDTVVGTLFLVAFLIISLLVLFDTHIVFEFPTFKKITGALRARRTKHTAKEYESSDHMKISMPETSDEDEEDVLDEDEEYEEEEIDEEDAEESTPKVSASRIDDVSIEAPIIGSGYVSTIPFTPPPLGLLEGDKGKPGVGDVKANANVIKRTLQNFGIDVEMDEVSIGPSVTRYAFKPAEGVRLSKILGLQNNLELALAAHPVRIEAPIPGKSLVGVEVPNSTRTTVGLKSLLGDKEYQDSLKPLLLALGRGVTGKLYFADLAKMPHLLVAGTTGSGKSVMMHSLINSLLFHNPPENLRFVMIDPKRVELGLYNKIPHLLTPVITDPKKAILALKWAGKEMERRYDVLEAETVQNIASYHKNVVEPAYAKLDGKEPREEDHLPERMPYIVILIDELADIMTMYPRELESAIVRLAQMSRAVGIHLVLSTQRPSVNVITGLIKANIPARIAFQVASQIDSRTILDMGGAEKLLGAGDMLYLSGEMSKPVRLQSPFLSETEVKKVTTYFIKHYGPQTTDEINLSAMTEGGGRNSLFETALGGGDDEDELYEDARMAVIEAGKASTSYLQRKLKIGYGRAARLIDDLEERGVVGPGEGSKPREVLEGAPSGETDEE